MASSINALSYLDPSAWQTLSTSSSASQAGSGAAVSATSELQALQKQGDFEAFFKNSLAAALLQPADGINSGSAATALVNDMLQQVLGAYQSTAAVSPTAGGTIASG